MAKNEERGGKISTVVAVTRHFHKFFLKKIKS